MQNQAVRIGLGALAGVVVAFLCIWLIEMVVHGVHGGAEGVDFGNRDEVARMAAAQPATVFLLVLAGWFAGSLLGAWTANAVAGLGRAGWIVALLVVAVGVATMAMIPHPWWMWAGAIALPPAAGWLAQRLAKVPT
jgi:hypothetical protein